jgi:hypothetical protein
MIGKIEVSPIKFRIDITPAQAGRSLVRNEADIVDFTEKYKAAVASHEVVDVGYEGNDGVWMRAIVAAQEMLQVYFPDFVDTSRPYVTDIFSQEDVIGFIEDSSFLEGRSNGEILDIGTGKDGEHQIAVPLKPILDHI